MNGPPDAPNLDAVSERRATCLQVVDFFGFGLPDIRKEMMSMHHTHDAWGSLVPKVMFGSVVAALWIDAEGAGGLQCPAQAECP